HVVRPRCGRVERLEGAGRGAAPTAAGGGWLRRLVEVLDLRLRGAVGIERLAETRLDCFADKRREVIAGHDRTGDWIVRHIETGSLRSGFRDDRVASRLQAVNEARERFPLGVHMERG